MSPVTLADVGAGFASPVHAAQQVFRALLDAMARPGSIQTLPAPALAGLQPPAPMGSGLCATLLTLLDADATLHLADSLAAELVHGYLRFHTGVRPRAAAQADFVVARAAEASAALWQQLQTGTDEAPQDSATLILDVPTLANTPRPGAPLLRLRGPGIRDSAQLAVAGLPADRAAAFWRARIAQEATFPLGIDLILVAGERVAALPRTTHIVLDAPEAC
jgi:alpha-D-ribose 1-methylphosphonate 5-triphosphate synthase subunit PhnH